MCNSGVYAGYTLRVVYLSVCTRVSLRGCTSTTRRVLSATFVRFVHNETRPICHLWENVNNEARTICHLWENVGMRRVLSATFGRGDHEARPICHLWEDGGMRRVLSATFGRMVGGWVPLHSTRAGRVY